VFENEYWTRFENLPPIEGSGYWANRRKNMRAHMVKEPPDKPWTWSTVIATMYVGHGNKKVIKAAKEIPPEWLGRLEGEEDAPNLVCQAYHLWRWLRRQSSLRLEDLSTIVEFGGGYGAMVVVCSALGFRGDYYIYDYPEMALMQEYHLGTREIECSVHWEPHPRKPDLFISCNGIDEAPLDEREAFLGTIRPSQFLIVAQHMWLDINNYNYFHDWAQRQFSKWRVLWAIEKDGNAIYIMSIGR